MIPGKRMLCRPVIQASPKKVKEVGKTEVEKLKKQVVQKVPVFLKGFVHRLKEMVRNDGN